MGEFGDKFRKTREEKELSLDDVSNVTKINPRMLQAIEEEHFDKLPGGVFNRGFIRAYAKHLGLNAEDAVSDYLACLGQAQIDSHNGWDTEKLRDPHEPATSQPGTARAFTPAAQGQQPPVQVEELPELQLPQIDDGRLPRKQYLGRSSRGAPWIWVATVISVVMAALFFSTRQNRDNSPTRPTSIPASASQPSTPAPVSRPAQRAVAPPVSTVPVAATRSPGLSAQSSTTAAPTPPPANPAAAPAKPAATEPDPNAVHVENKNDVTIRSLGDTTAKPDEKPAVQLTLVVRASQNTRISVTSDGKLVTQETLIAPAAATFHAARELVVQVANAAGVRFLLNGQEVAPQGAEGGAKTFTFDSQGMHAAESPQPAQN